MKTTADIRADLLGMQDLPFRDFQSALMPAVPKELVIGVRMPVLRAYAKELARDPEGREAFLADLPHEYHEEKLLHALLLEQERDFDAVIRELDRFLPFVDDWSTCDCFNPRVLGKHRAELLPHIDRWLAAEDVFAVRYAIGLLMRSYLDDAFDPSYLARVAAVTAAREEYYICMMVAWYFATALAKQEEAVLPYFEKGRLPEPTRRKAIRKALESYRIRPDRKAFLRTIS
ncbi:MAG TPA: DNA alkylation repair protein [Clostridiales bacterium]|nr:DNA alkylation repair protein [Clostridiales bacterium]